MKFNRLFDNDRAVSPVIGVILMVAITVILAAVIGTFVLGIAPGDDPAPSAQISFQDANETTNSTYLVHNGGDTIELGDVTLLVDGDSEVGNSTITGTLSAGERLNVTDVNLSEDEADLALRHDPSGSIIGSSTVDVSSE